MMPDHDLDELIANLHSTDEELCRQSVKLLGGSDDERGLEPLIEVALSRSHHILGLQAQWALERLIQTPAVTDLLLDKLLEDASTERIELIARLARETSGPRVVDVLLSAWKKHPDSYYLQEYAAWTAIRAHRFSAQEHCGAERVNVLVVDDEPRYRRLIAADLRTENLSMVGAENGVDAYEFTKICQPDLVLLDVIMPKLDGFNACLRIKADPTTQKIPVVFCTAKGQDRDITMGMEVGADEYLVKPFSAEKLVESIKRIMQKSRLGIYDETD